MNTSGKAGRETGKDTVVVALLRRAVSRLAADIKAGADVHLAVRVFHRRAQRALAIGKTGVQSLDGRQSAH